MKKRIFQIALASMFVIYASCSSESDVVTQKSNTNSSILKSDGLSEKEFDEAKGMYAEMILTAEYKAFNLSLKDFREKMLVKNAPFTTKAEAMLWINSNLSNTNFSSVNAFETDLDNLTGAMGNIMSNNKGLFNHLANANGGQMSQIVKPITPIIEYPPVTNACLDGCIGTFEAGYDAAQAQYERNTDQKIINDPEAVFWNMLVSWGQATAQETLDEAINNLVSGYNLCAGSCG